MANPTPPFSALHRDRIQPFEAAAETEPTHTIVALFNALHAEGTSRSDDSTGKSTARGFNGKDAPGIVLEIFRASTLEVAAPQKIVNV